MLLIVQLKLDFKHYVNKRIAFSSSKPLTMRIKFDFLRPPPNFELNRKFDDNSARENTPKIYPCMTTCYVIKFKFSK